MVVLVVLLGTLARGSGSGPQGVHILGRCPYHPHGLNFTASPSPSLSPSPSFSSSSSSSWSSCSSSENRLFGHGGDDESDKCRPNEPSNQTVAITTNRGNAPMPFQAVPSSTLIQAMSDVSGGRWEVGGSRWKSPLYDSARHRRAGSVGSSTRYDSIVGGSRTAPAFNRSNESMSS